MTTMRIARHEFLCRARNDSPYPVLAFSVAVVGLVALLSTWLAGTMTPRPGVLGSTTYSYLTNAGFQAAQRLTVIFLALLLGLVAVALVSGPIASGSTLNRERDGRAIEALLLTGARPLEIIGGKLIAALARTFFVLAGALPLFSVAWLYGGPPWTLIVVGIAIVIVVAVLATAIGLVTASLVRDNVAALFGASLVLACLVLAAPAAYVAATAISGQIDWARLAGDIVPLGIGRSTAFSTGSFGSVYRGLASPATTIGTSDYVWLMGALLGDLAIAALAFLLCSVLLDPYHPLRQLRLSSRRSMP